MTRAQERNIRNAIRHKVGYRFFEVEAYIIGAHGFPADSEADTNAGCDAKQPLRELSIAMGDRLDCNVYVRELGEVNLSENVEVRIVPDGLIVLNTLEVARDLAQ